MLIAREQLAAAIERRAHIERGIFESAPKSWEEFQQRFGRWLEVNDTIENLEILIKQEDDEL